MRVAELLLADYRQLVPGAPAPFRFGTWIGGDLDGNPAAGPETIAEALERARELALTAYVGRGARARPARSGISNRLVPRSPELDASIARDERELPDVRRRARRPEPRRALPAEAQLRLAAAPKRARAGAGPGYASAAAFAADLDLIDREPARGPRRSRVADGRLAALRRRVELFGFHLAKLDVRVHANELAPARSASARRSPPSHARVSEHGAEALDTLIVSGTTSAGRRARRARRRRGRGPRPLARPALRDDRVAPLGGGDRGGAARRPALRRPRRASGDRGSRSWSATRTRARTAAT